MSRSAYRCKGRGISRLASAPRIRHRVVRPHVAAVDTPQTMAALHSEALPAELSERFQKFVAEKPQIILGTQSRSRRAVVDELAEAFEFKYSSITADIDEKAIRRPTPHELVLVLAHAKADAIIKKLEDSNSLIRPGYLVTCDQVVVHNGELREKPESAEEARTFIRSYGDAPTTTIGACVCVCLDTGVRVEDVEYNHIHMERMSEEHIEELIREGHIFASAGGLLIEHPLVQPYLTRIQGSTEGIMGLSKQAFMRVVLKTVEDSGSSVDE